MKFNLEHSTGNMIRSYAAGEIHILLGRPQQTGQPEPDMLTVKTSLILTAEQLIEDWIADSEELSSAHLDRLLATEPEIIVLGTGDRIRFPAPVLLAQCHAAGVGIEVMDTGAACRTYNILAAEGRKVCAAFTRV